jgi:UDP-N-acetylmuramoyl-tripeptide--D-alanyl-D-alanine ligase
MSSQVFHGGAPGMDRAEGLARRLRDLGGRLIGGDAAFRRVVTDSRAVEKGDLFVALVGDRFDGHDFVRSAASLGAAAALVSRPLELNFPQIVVPDTLLALQQYAASWRADFDVPVVAVTGSNGKTTTKQLLAAVFAARGPVLATVGNLNNHIGVPLTLTRLRRDHKTAVIEMGANHPGEIARLAEIAAPQVGVVTQAGDAHLEGFGSREGVARAKGELFSALGARGVAVINADDPYAPLWRSLAAEASIIRFGFSDLADVRASEVQVQRDQAATRFELRTPEGRAEVLLPLPGRHNVMNALAAAACGTALGMNAVDIAAGLAQVQAPGGRVAWKQTRNGARLIDDSYNANPTSMRAGLELLAQQRRPRWAVLGGMGELGAESGRLHEEIGAVARRLGIERLYAFGPTGAHYARGYGHEETLFDDYEPMIAALEKDLAADVTLLVKGSRSARMERVVQRLCSEATAEA